MKLKQLFYTGLSVLCCLAFFNAQAQNSSKPLSTELFQLVSESQLAKQQLEFVPSDYDLLTLDFAALQELREKAPEQLVLSIPSATKSSMELELTQTNLFSSSFSIHKSSSPLPVETDLGIHYHGKLQGNENSTVAISVFNDQVIGLISSNAGNLVIGKLGNSMNAAQHIIYDDKEILSELGFSCDTPDDGKGYTAEELADASEEKLVDNCVNLYFEVDHDIFLNKGGIDPTTEFVIGMYNQVAIIYLNEEIQTAISEIFIWDTPSPYSSGSSGVMLSQFQSFRTDFNGDLGQLLSYQASGGVAAGFNGICNSNRAQSLSFSSINTTYSDFPTFSWNIMVISHEFGHIWGSRHTHACVWNGNNTAIDGCAGFTEGGCPVPDIPVGGGTIMSYCHLNAGINFNLGFGLQPGNVIRNRTENGNCLSECATCDDGIQNGDEEGVDCGGNFCDPCTVCDDGVQNGDEEGVDCGGSLCPPCDEVVCENNGVSIELNFDLRANQNSWQITNSAGNVVAAGGPYDEYAGQIGQQYTQNVCLPDACYTFTIFDSFGDGMCCRRGNGSYVVRDYQTGTILASGGVFGNEESTAFCLGDIVDSCNDGIQNGDEEGVDCGGSLCPPCNANPTCDDGVQNGDEEGVDCGGSFCPPCSSCNDGVQNGDEEGVDCGGSSCPPCPTCFDGVQNGDEEGVDCGGSTCPPCESGECLVPTGTYVQYFANPTFVIVHWDAMPGATSYGIRYRQLGGSSWFNATSNTNSRFLTHLAPGFTYEYQLRSVCNNGVSAWSESYTFTAGGNLEEGSDNTVFDIVNLFPNPTKDNLQITLLADETGAVNVIVYDVLGRAIVNRQEAVYQGRNLITLDVSSLESGYHMLQILKGDHQLVQRFVKE